MRRIYLLILLLFSLACSNDKPVKSASAIHAFYYWQTSLYTFDWNDSLYQSMDVSKVYYRFFDVGWSEEAHAPIPISPLDVEVYNWETRAEVVPVVFITNETFKNLSREQSTNLARQVHKKVMAQLNELLMNSGNYALPTENEEDYWKHNPYGVQSKNFDEQKKRDSLYVAKMKTIREIQFDCDWTPSTKDKYFTFLEEAKKLFKEQVISSTIRLYQYKYPKQAGLPPVKRGMLMCYNAGNVKDAKTRNSIFDKKEIMAYLEASEYPIPLDYALPVFQWALLYHDNELQRIFSTTDLLQDYQAHFNSMPDNRLEAVDDFVYGYSSNSIFVRKGDEIRLESPNMQEVAEVAAWLSEHKNNKEAILSLYHLNTYDLKKHSQAIKAIFSSF